MLLKPKTIRTVDQMGREVTVPEYPQRIISLVPSQTELLYDLGLGERVVGITRFCIHPKEWFYSKTRVGGTKTYHDDRIASLQPDLIIGNKEENEQEGIVRLAAQYPVWMSDIKTPADALDMIRAIGMLTQTEKKAGALANEIAQDFAGLKPIDPPIRTAYLIWRDPWMTAGHDTFITRVMQHMGLENCAADMPSRYPELTAEQLRELGPRLVLLSSEPYPFKEKHMAELREICPGAVIKLVDGEMFSWYGSRLKLAIPYLVQLQREIIPSV